MTVVVDYAPLCSLLRSTRRQGRNAPGKPHVKPRILSGPPKAFLLLLFVFVFFQSSHPRISCASDIPVGRLVNPQGSVDILPFERVSWEAAENGRELFGGDSLKTGRDSRVSVLCVDETQLKLNENTIVVLKSAAPSARMGIPVPATLKEKGSSLYGVQTGEIWLRNKNEKARFEIQTPAVTVGIRGTEFNLKVDRAGTTSLVLLDGKLTLANSQGRIDLDPGEEGFAEVGKAPVKRIILQPKDAVQWSLYYPGIFSYRDIPLGEGPEEPASAILLSAQTSYDRGDMESSERDVSEVLARDPENGQALLILGWIALQRQNPQEAIKYFERARRQNASPGLAVCGLALAGYRMGDIVGSYKLMSGELKKDVPSLVLVMSGYFSMLVGKIDEAKKLLTDSRISGRDAAIAHSLLSQIYLTQNSKEDAAREAAAALEANGESPMARMTSALVKISYFELPKAMKLLDRSLAADPHFLEAYVYLARLWLGADYLDRAWKIIGKAMEISKTDSDVLSLAGFICLGYRDYDKASALFAEAIKNNPGFGEPHIGLANIAFRNRNFGLGLSEMLTATLLEPRVSLYQSSLGKALYQAKSFDKALEVYDYSKTLDPNDPTPYLYKGIALTDLYRPGEAIQEINKSIELNDNMAIFRSRLMLDRDLAVRNTDLAVAYNQLGLGEWAMSKAVTAVNKDPLSPSAHRFLSSAYSAIPERAGASNSELLLYWLLSPANENTFSPTTNGNTTDYTQMFEMPYVRADIESITGTWADHQAPILTEWMEVFGGRPGLALAAQGDYQNNPGFKGRNDDSESFNGYLYGKFEPTIKDSFFANYNQDKSWQGDTGGMEDFSYQTNPTYKATDTESHAMGGYVHRFSPAAVFIGYFNWGRLNDLDRWNAIPQPQDVWSYYHRYIWDFNNIQLQQQVNTGNHNIMAGLDYFTGYLHYNQHDTWVFDSFPPVVSNLNFTPGDRATTGYVRDYWSISPKLVVELGISADVISSSREGFPDSISSSTINPSVGLNYEIDKSNTLRLAYQSYATSDSNFVSNLAPAEVAGFPSQVNTEDGSKVKELGFSWESQWNPKMFTVLSLQAYRVDDPQYEGEYEVLIHSNVIDYRTERVQGSYTVNCLLSSSLGLSTGVAGKIVSLDDPTHNFLTGNFNEISGNVALSYMHQSGWFASIKDTLVYQDLGGLSDKGLAQEQAELGNPFNLVDVNIGKYFNNKRGWAQLTITNIFNEHYSYTTEPAALWWSYPFYPDRQIMFRLGFNF
jgi:tetratricopeptide (TPR) repeat protein